MRNMRSGILEFDPVHNKVNDEKELRHGLSVALQVDNTLWVTNDETTSLERLTLQGKDSWGNFMFGNHEHFKLGDYITLPASQFPGSPGQDENDEADVEGLDYKDNYLWVVGSHSLKREKAKKKAEPEKNLDNLSDKKVARDPNRFLLARIPMVKDDNNKYILHDKPVVVNGKTLTPAKLRNTKNSNDLIDILRKDDHLAKFLEIPGKENGFDIEGLAVSGKRIFIGLRGPVLRGWAVILELEVEEGNGENATELTLKPPVKKHFLELGGLGIRDLIVHDSDLLILAGPSMDIDGPVTIFRWEGGARPSGTSFVFSDMLFKVMDVPYGQGEDHAEGMTLFSTDGGKPDSILVVYDSAAKSRNSSGQSRVTADIFPL